MGVMSMTEQQPSNPLELAYAVAALQTGSNAMGLLSAVPQSLDDHSSKVSHHRDATKQTPGSGSNEESCIVSVRAATPDLPQMKEEDSDQRLARSRERNREHARRTRLRKKAHLESLQSKVKGLEAERQVLKQNLDECGIASILLGLSAGGHEMAETVDLESSTKHDGASHMVALLATGKRKRFLTESMPDKHPAQPQALTLNIDGEVTSIGGGKSHINWKTGMYRGEDGNQKQLTAEQLENLRRERNRMHAKMTRDRKKCFIATIEKTIDDLEKENCRMRAMLSKLSASKFSQLVTPVTSPSLAPTEGPIIPVDEESPVYSPTTTTNTTAYAEIAPKRVCHGFSLDR